MTRGGPGAWSALFGYQRFVFPIQVAVGTLLGRYERYAGAPEPVRR